MKLDELASEIKKFNFKNSLKIQHMQILDCIGKKALTYSTGLKQLSS